ncbi:immunoglobulin-binding protein 1b [Caerostris extrusa]|uniref:Immunoglobulin-binding protein 1b n=1 Tax=Caerostris extrusa TaxID=172846 RepID=A0AAV4XH78_CAEEX|nr:immunoglobulin-binding protein 1b [Caerostris extrusa]
MTNSELTNKIKSLKDLVANTDDERNCVELSKLFDSCLQLRELIENSSLPSNDKELQEAVCICIKVLERCTVMVNELELFSSNETADELQTSSIRYLTLPAILGSLNLIIQNKDLSDRMKYVEMSEVYFRDFLLRCTNYELCETSLKYFKESLENGDLNEVKSDPSTLRDKRIQQFKRKKELETKEKTLKPALERPESEEYIREYYFVLIEKWILIAVEELENLRREKEILKNIPKKENLERTNLRDPKSSPLKPFILTKNAVQKQIFGLGYPSVPVLTIDDYYQQKFAKMVNEHKTNKPGQSLQDAALSGKGLDKEAEDIQKEELMERDDPIALMKARQWDEWKDDNPRGSGNRKNKG